MLAIPIHTHAHTRTHARTLTHSHLHFIYLLVTWLQGGHHTIHLFFFFNLFLFTCSSSGPKAIAQSISAASMIRMAPMEILKTEQNSSLAFTCALAQILKSQCFSTFTIERHCREYFWDCVPWPWHVHSPGPCTAAPTCIHSINKLILKIIRYYEMITSNENPF